MADLRIVDAPLLSIVKGTEKIPTGGEGNFSVSVNQVADFAKLRWVLATEGYVDSAVGNVQADLNLHKNNESNPHNVTKTQVGLGNVDNTADLDKPVSNATQSAIITANSGKADKSYVDSQDQLKADKITTYTKTEVDSEFLSIYQNGAALPYDATMEYAEGAVVVKDGELQKKQGASWIPAANKGYNLDYFVSGKSYPLNAEIMLTNGDIAKSTIANNIINPNVDMTGWENESEHNSSYGLMTGSQIQDVKDGVSSFDASGIIQSLITDPNEGDATIKRGTYFIGSSGIQLTGVKDKKIIFEKGVVFKWHPLVEFSTNVRMFSLTDCENITFDGMVLRGANNPDVWVKTEKVIRAGLIDKQSGVLQINCKKIKFNAPDIQNFQWGIYTLASSANKSSNIEINDGYLTGNYCGIVWESYIIDGITSCDILNTRSNNNWKWGMWMEAGDLSKDSRYIRNIKMIGGSLSGQVEEHGCYVQGEDHLFSGVDIENNNLAGLRMYSCARLRVIGNKFTGNGFNANGIGYLSGAAFIGTDTDGSRSQFDQIMLLLVIMYQQVIGSLLLITNLIIALLLQIMFVQVMGQQTV